MARTAMQLISFTTPSACMVAGRGPKYGLPCAPGLLLWDAYDEQPATGLPYIHPINLLTKGTPRQRTNLHKNRKHCSYPEAGKYDHRLCPVHGTLTSTSNRQYEFVAIHKPNTAAIENAAEMLDRIKNYPILDEDRFAQAKEDYYTSIGYVQEDSGEWVPAEPASQQCKAPCPKVTEASGPAGTDPPIRLFAYSPSRSAAAATPLYAGMRAGGVLRTDGYEVYNQIAQAHQLVHLACWTHCRRYFIEALDGLPKAARTPEEPAAQFIALIAQLYALESRAQDLKTNTDSTTKTGGDVPKPKDLSTGAGTELAPQPKPFVPKPKPSASA